MSVKVPNYWSLQSFEKIYEDEKQKYRRSLEKLKLENKIIEKHLVDYCFPVSKKYFKENCLKLTCGGWCVKLDDKDRFEIKDDSTFEKVYGKTVDKCIKNLTTLIFKRYNADVYNENFRIEHGKEDENGKVNLTKFMNYSYDKNVKKLGESEKKMFDLILNGFIKDIIVNSNVEHFEFLKRIISSCVHRKLSQVITILGGVGGTGKSTFMEILHLLLGDAFQSPDPDKVAGKKSEFNEYFEGVSLCYVEETSGKGEDTYKDMFKKMKELSTSSTLSIRKLYSSEKKVANSLNFFISTNYTDDVKRDRRMFVLETSNKRIGDKEFFGEIHKAMENKTVLQHLFNYFYDIDCKNMASEQIPETELMKDKALIETDLDRFLLQTFVYEQSKTTSATLSELFKMYNEWRSCNSKKQIDPNGKSSFNSSFRIMLKEAGKNKDKTQMYDVSEDGIKNVFKHIRKWSEKDFENKMKEYNGNGQNSTADIVEFFKTDETEDLKQQLKESKKRENNLLKRIEELEKLLEKGKEEPKTQMTKKPNSKSNYNHEEFMTKLAIEFFTE